MSSKWSTVSIIHQLHMPDLHIKVVDEVRGLEPRNVRKSHRTLVTLSRYMQDRLPREPPKSPGRLTPHELKKLNDLLSLAFVV